ncbi:saccharopine dehydrogenase (NAD+, L-lysine forming) [Sporothrix brasiliensis 5110]|uniref:Saccharopine dehydrogenase [NAD(+), L-lysine-forming] n=1 Tax=Sporothrix brasiliensis 5110 TaxID=1398154 RepID=A0A0C2EUI6_9PEZI|nr:saccharopine dehydrogenase (NAD+, L-lysine forming) [Sporothrix brasiliensis 5110]KIH90199.1 saccharopine dehydrogenase (NAD+, L-lysine forming) [Sporothrix brasiliensis 5110]
MAPTIIHLRAETKPLERLSPASAKALLDAGYVLHIERSSDRIYKDSEYEAVGAEMVPAGTWVNAPTDHIILGLKEITDGDAPLPHNYIHFQHCFKKQDGWAEALSRFARGNGRLYDLEFLVEPNGRRVAAFGYWAGYAGTAIALLAWAHQILRPGTPQSAVPVFDSAPALADHVKAAMAPAIAANNGELPRAIVIGALGRCGKGARDFCVAAGLPKENILEWDLPETKRGGPFEEVATSDIFVNCVYLGAARIPPFVTFESLAAAGASRRLRVICDVSCDPNSANNPIPLYSTYSSFTSPTVPVSQAVDGPELRVIAIDHLPTLVARESSDEFSQLLLPSLLTLDKRQTEGVWTRAQKTFEDRVSELPKSS